MDALERIDHIDKKAVELAWKRDDFVRSREPGPRNGPALDRFRHACL